MLAFVAAGVLATLFVFLGFVRSNVGQDAALVRDQRDRIPREQSIPGSSESASVSMADGPMAEAGSVYRQEERSASLETLLGNIEVLADVTFASGIRALVICSVDVGRADFVQLVTTNGQTVVDQRTKLAPTMGSDCGECSSTASYTTDEAEPVIYGSCQTGGTSGVGTAFLVARPMGGSATALALTISCGGTWFVEEEDGLVLYSHAIRAGATAPERRFPTVRFTSSRTGGFQPEDEELLRHYCHIIHDDGLIVSSSFHWSDRDLSYVPVETSIGTLGLHDPVLIGLDREICNTLESAFWNNRRADQPETGVLADIVGLEAPEGLDDWHFVCQSQD